MKHFINLRTYTHPNPWKGKDQKEHSYYVGHEIGGLSDVAETVITVDESNNFVTIREIIEEQRDENIMRRRRFYYEFIQLMQRCPNIFDYEGDALKSYRLAFLKKGNTGTKKGYDDVAKDIKLIKLSDETKPICDMVDDMFSFELVLIPTTQIHPKTGRLTDQP